MLFRIKADSSDATAKFKAFKSDLNALEKEAKSTGTGFERLAASAGLTASEFDTLKIGTAAVAAGVTALVAGTVAGVAALYKLTKAASDYGSEIYDASQKTGLSATSLSALKYAAEQSGSSFEGVTAAVSKFNVLLGDAKLGNEKAIATLQQFGITAKGTNEALAQAIKVIAEETDVTKQAAAAKALFKDRTGEILPVIQSFNGDLPALIAHLKELGLTMSDQDAAAADAFGDQMDTLEKQLAGVARTIGFAVMPEFQRMATELSDFLKSNPGEVEAWGKTFGYVLRYLGTAILEIKDNIAALQDQWTMFKNMDFTVPDEIKGRMDQRATNLQKYNNIYSGTDWGSQGARTWGQDLNDDPRSSANQKPLLNPSTMQADTSKADEEAKKAAEKRRKEIEDARKRELAAQKEHIKLMLDAAREQFKLEQDDLEKHFRAKEITEENYRKNTEENLRHYAKAARDASLNQFNLDSQGKTPSEVQNLRDARIAAEKAVYNEIIKEKESAEKTITEVNKKSADEQKADNKRSYQESVEDFEQAQAKKQALAYQYAQENNITEEDQARYSEKLAIETAEFKIEQLKKYGGSVLDIKRLETDLEILRAKHAGNEAKRQQDALDTEREIHDEKRKHWNEYIEFLTRQEELEMREAERKSAELAAEQERTRTSNSGVGGGIAGALGIQLPSLLDDQGQLKTQAEYIKSVYADVSDFAGQAIGSMIGGLADLVTQWIMTGKFSGKAMMAMVANVALGLAMQAGIKAIFELAEGYAALALTWGVPNPSSIAHFAAAGIYATVAGVAGAVGVGAALIARSMGDDKTKTASSAAGSTATRRTNTGSGVYSSQEEQTIDVSRNAPGGRNEIIVSLNEKSGWFTDIFKIELRRNGDLRDLIRDAATA